jgi:2-amino-4,5-dihydroxy-6-oxo-7-(phosphonooxy)heptanoate synthase
LLKVPVPLAEPGPERIAAVRRVTASVGVPVLFLGGPRREAPDEELLAEVADVMAGGAGGLALGRAIYQHPTPGAIAERLSAAVHRR